MEKQRLFLPLNIQYFADGDPAPEPPKGPEPGTGDNPDDKPDNKDNPEPKDEKTYTQAEVEKMMKERIAREQKAKEKAIEEAEKLAKMNSDQKKEYEHQKLMDELEELRKKDAFYGLAKEATSMLTEKGIQADDELLQVLVRDTAEDTQASVSKFAEIVNQKVEEGVKKALAGTSPRVTGGTGKPMTKAEIMAIKDTEQRLKAIRENPELFGK